MNDRPPSARHCAAAKAGGEIAPTFNPDHSVGAGHVFESELNHNPIKSLNYLFRSGSRELETHGRWTGVAEIIPAGVLDGATVLVG